MLHQTTTELIKKIHESRLFGIFVEMGCGNPVAHELCKVPGASNTIFYAENAYDKDFSKEKYNLKSRFVSKETILSISQTLDELTKASIGSGSTVSNSKAKINLQYISTFQIGNFNDVSTHGFIGIKRKFAPLPTIYHISIHESLSREQYIDKIADIGLKLIGRDPEIACYDDIDCVDATDRLQETIFYISKSKYHAFAYIKSNGEICRLEDLLRTSSDNIIIYKGSFNPVHNGHIEISNKIKELYPNSIFCFSISTNIYDKGSSHFEDLAERVRILNKLEYEVLIYNRPLFSDMLEVLTSKTNKKIIFPIGFDTYRRISNIQNLDADFCVFDRGDRLKDHHFSESNIKSIFMNREISSSDIRQQIKGNIDVSNLIPSGVLDDIILKYKID